MRHTMTLTVVCAGLLVATSARAQTFTRESFPLEPAARPLILPSGMVEMRAGFMSDFVGQETDDVQVRSRLDAQYAPLPRAQLGVETDMMVFPTDAFEVREVSGWAQYELFPSFSLRVGGYAALPSVPDAMTGERELGDSELGVRAGFPFKLALGKRFALFANPRYGVLVKGGEQQDLDVPFTAVLALIPQISVYVSSNVKVADVANFDSDDPNVALYVPVAGGVVLTPGNNLDLGVDVRMTDVTDEPGRKSRWVFAYLAIRR